MISSLFIIRIIAILLIVNSHLSSIYPFPALSFGGHLGNSIFYLISGYGLSLSYQHQPLTIVKWFKKRFIKILIPLIIILGILNIGDLKGLQNDIWWQIIWHSSKQLELFLPVLLVLYVFFLPLNALLKKQYIIYSFAFIIILPAILFFIRMNSGEPYRGDLPSEGIFFSVNALACFIFGIMFSKVELGKISRTLSLTHIKLLLIIVGSQIIHKLMTTYFLNLIWINFYLNFLCVAAMFLLFISINFQLSIDGFNILKGIATSSLAIYLVQFKIIMLAEHIKINFPYSILFVFVHSLLWAYAVSLFIEILSKKILNKVLHTVDWYKILNALHWLWTWFDEKFFSIAHLPFGFYINWYVNGPPSFGPGFIIK